MDKPVGKWVPVVLREKRQWCIPTTSWQLSQLPASIYRWRNSQLNDPSALSCKKQKCCREKTRIFGVSDQAKEIHWFQGHHLRIPDVLEFFFAYEAGEVNEFGCPDVAWSIRHAQKWQNCFFAIKKTWKETFICDCPFLRTRTFLHWYKILYLFITLTVAL